MKRFIYSTVILGIIATISISCDKDKDYVKLVNRSHQDIYVYDAYEREDLLPLRQAELGNIINKYYRSGNYKTYTAYFDIDEELCDTLFISVISVDTLKKYSWEKSAKQVLELAKQFGV